LHKNKRTKKMQKKWRRRSKIRMKKLDKELLKEELRGDNKTRLIKKDSRKLSLLYIKSTKRITQKQLKFRS